MVTSSIRLFGVIVTPETALKGTSSASAVLTRTAEENAPLAASDALRPSKLCSAIISE